jgi:peroxiredoxin (alkyl hydroperoxide reductase subunit C)
VDLRGIEFGSQPGAQVGESAPDFDLPVLLGGVKGRLRLRDELREKNVVLAFYPGNWEEVSARQMLAYQAQRMLFKEQGAEVIGISVDSIMNTTVWERAIGPVDFPLCSDFWPHGAVSIAYGVLRQGGTHEGRSERAVVVVSRNGTIAFRRVYGDADLPPVAETLDALRVV